MDKKVYNFIILVVVMAAVLVLPAVAVNPVTIQFKNNSELVDLLFSDVLLEGVTSQIAKGADGYKPDITPVNDEMYINVHYLTVSVGSTITEVLLPGSHGLYSITVEDNAGEIIDFYSMYTADELDAMIVAAAFAGNENDYKYYLALREEIKSGLKTYLTTRASYSGPKDKHSGLQRRETVYEICTTGEYTLWFQPDSADGAAMAIKLTVTDGTTPPVLPVEQAPEPTPVPPQAFVAVPTSSAVYIDGTEISFDAYNINDNNYFKLRDLAYALNGSGKRFEVTWDEAENAIRLISGVSYTAVGGEMTEKGSENKTPMPTTAKILLDGKELNLTAYNIEGNNYFKLRDVGKAFDFNVSWDGLNNAIDLNTTGGYTEG